MGAAIQAVNVRPEMDLAVRRTPGAHIDEIDGRLFGAVAYTHLTLPTIYSVYIPVVRAS